MNIRKTNKKYSIMKCIRDLLILSFIMTISMSIYFLWKSLVTICSLNSNNIIPNNTQLHYINRYNTSTAYLQLKKYKYYIGIMTKVNIISHIGLCRLIEWIEYNLLIGVDHIYITDDCSDKTLDLKSSLDIYIELGYVTLIPSYMNYEKQCLLHSKTSESQQIINMFSNYIKNNCEWIAFINSDEYITFWNNNFKLTDILLVHPEPILRISWWIMGSDSQETINPGLLIENSHYGTFSRLNIRSIARYEEIDVWSNPLFPYFKNSYRLLSNGMTLKNYTEYDYSWSFDYSQINVFGNVLDIPKPYSIFIKHYKYASYEEYLIQKARFRPSDISNPWKFNRDIWLLGNYSKFDVASDFTSNIAKQIRNNLLSHNVTTMPTLKECLNYWKL